MASSWKLAGIIASVALVSACKTTGTELGAGKRKQRGHVGGRHRRRHDGDYGQHRRLRHEQWRLKHPDPRQRESAKCTQ